MNVGGAVRMELFALESSGAYVKSIALRIGCGGARALLASNPACIFERKTQDFTRYFQSLDTNSCELIVIDRAGGIFSLSTPSFVPITCLLIFLVAVLVSFSPTDAFQREERKSFIHG